jgi:L-rhamnose mutarotase
MTIFHGANDTLFIVSEIRDEAAWDRLWDSPIHRKWAAVMEPLMHLTPDGKVDAGELREIFRLPLGS